MRGYETAAALEVQVVADRNQLISYAFDFGRGTIARESQVVADAIIPSGDRHELPAAIDSTGILVCQRIGAGGEFVQIGLDGTVQRTMAGADRFRSPAVSPDGTRIAFDMMPHSDGAGRLVWIHDLQRGVRTLISERGELSDSATWSADGQTVYFTGNRDGWKALRKAASGAGAPEMLGAPPGSKDMTVLDVAGDGRYLLVTTLVAQANWDLYLLPLNEPNAKWTPWASTPASESGARFSPDSRWIAYVSTASGSNEIYVSPLDDPSHRWQISSNGGVDPVWTTDGTRVPSRAPTDDLMSAEVVVSKGEVRAGAPRRLFDLRSVGDWSPRNVYDVLPDGKSIVVLRRLTTEDGTIHVKTGVTYGR